MKKDKENKTSWGDVADWYNELVEESDDSYQKKVIMPNLLRIVDPKTGITILDNACGQGYFARAFANNGAKVIAADISPELIGLASKKKDEEGARNDVAFHRASAHELKFIQDETVDTVTIVLALQNIEKLSETVAECSRVLKKGGRFVFVLNHPAFRIPGRSGWEWDEKNQLQFRRIGGYMSDDQIRIDMTPGETDEKKKKFTISFHRPLQSYIKALNKAGFFVSRFEEWISHKKSQPGPRAKEEDRMRKEIPLFLCIEAKKISF